MHTFWFMDETGPVWISSPTVAYADANRWIDVNGAQAMQLVDQARSVEVDTKPFGMMPTTKKAVREMLSLEGEEPEYRIRALPKRGVLLISKASD